jgi:hypothetical protein
MRKVRCAALFLIGVLVMGCGGGPDPLASAGPLYTGDGGKGKGIAILAPKAIGLAEDQEYLPGFVQGEFVSNFTGYSDISVLDRQRLFEQYAELQSGWYDDNAKEGADMGHLPPTEYIMGGSITKTVTGYGLQMSITRTDDKTTPASYSANCTFAELDNLTVVRRASLSLLEKIGVTVTERGRTELSGAAAVNHVNAQAALAQGIVAQQKGTATAVTAAAYYYQAAVFDPSLLEATNRRSVMTANISSGNIGNDTRNEIRWQEDWKARLAETEQYFARLFRSSTPSYGLSYLTAFERGAIDFTKKTTSLSFQVNLHAFSTWFDLVPAAVLQEVRDGLNATKKKDTWGFGYWPRQTVTNLNPFQGGRNDFAVVFELVNDKGDVIGRQSLSIGGSWGFNFSSEKEVTLNYQENDSRTVTFRDVNANKISDTLTIRVASVNGAAPETVTRNGSLQITALSEFPSDFEFSRGVITKYTGKEGRDIVIPASIWGDPVKRISKSAFEGKKLTGVTILDGVTSIEERAFLNCGLTRATIPASVTRIGSYAFGDTVRYNLTSVTFGGNSTRLDNDAFSYPLQAGQVRDRGGLLGSLFRAAAYKYDDLADAYNEGGAGTYVNSVLSGWEKQ